MAKNTKRDPSNPILNSPYEAPELHYATDEAGNLNQLQPEIGKLSASQLGGTLVGGGEERADEMAFMRVQESSMRRFWEETAEDGL